MFIVIDGIDGSGKGTQLTLVQKELEQKGNKVLILDFPRYGEKSAFAVEKYLNGEYGTELSAKQKSIFFAIDRFDALHNISNDFEKYDYIISNRYVSANMIHQGGLIDDPSERKDFLDWLENLEYNILKIPKPDKIIFLNVTPEMSSILVEKKEKREYIKGDENKDINESDANHMINAYRVANEIVDMYGDWIKIDCEKDGQMLSKGIITKKILQTINIV